MNIRAVGVLGIGLLIGIIFGATILLSAPPTSVIDTPPTVGKPVPQFSLVLSDGETVSNKTFIGKPLIINFWATWCPPCREEMPIFANIHQKYSDNVIILGINADEDPVVVKDFVRQFSISFRIGIDDTGNLSRKFFARSLPVTYFVDKDGIIRGQHLGTLTEIQANKYLRDLGVNP